MVTASYIGRGQGFWNVTVICYHLLAVQPLSTSFPLGITWQKVYLPQKEKFDLGKIKNMALTSVLQKACGRNALTTSALMGLAAWRIWGSRSRRGVAESGDPAPMAGRQSLGVPLPQQRSRSGVSHDFARWATSRKIKSFTLFSSWRHTHFSRPPSCHLEKDFLSEESWHSIWSPGS